VTLLAVLALAAEAAFPLSLPLSVHVEMRMAYERESIRDGRSAKASSGAVYDKTIIAAPGGYRVTLKPTEVRLPPIPADRAKFKAVTERLARRTLVYSADANLYPMAMADWPATLAGMRDSLREVVGDTPEGTQVLEGAMATFTRMRPEDAPSLMLREDCLLAMAVNATLDAKKPTTFENKVINPFGGDPIRALGMLKLERVDRAAGVGVVRWSQRLDPDQANASVRKALKIMHSTPEAPLSAEESALIDKVTIQNNTDCVFEIGLASGLPTKADCSIKVATIDPETNQSIARNEHWVITQTLKN
jgi:hypothetical protein